MDQEFFDKLAQTVIDGEADVAVQLVNEGLGTGVDPIEAIEKGLLQSAHDISEGGLAVCIAECAFSGDNRTGCTLHLNDRIRSDTLLFGESQSRIIVTTKPENRDAFAKIARDQNVPIEEIGTTGGDNITVYHNAKKIIDLPVQKLYTIWKRVIPDHFKAP